MKANSPDDQLCNVTKDWLTGLLNHAERAEAALPPIDNLTGKELIQRLEIVSLLGYIKSAEHILEMHG